MNIRQSVSSYCQSGRVTLLRQKVVHALLGICSIAFIGSLNAVVSEMGTLTNVTFRGNIHVPITVSTFFTETRASEKSIVLVKNKKTKKKSFTVSTGLVYCDTMEDAKILATVFAKYGGGRFSSRAASTYWNMPHCAFKRIAVLDISKSLFLVTGVEVGRVFVFKESAHKNTSLSKTRFFVVTLPWVGANIFECEKMAKGYEFDTPTHFNCWRDV